MNGRPSRGFIARRFSNEELLGLHLTLGVLLGLVFLGVFATIGALVRGTEPPTIDTTLEQRLREQRTASPAMRTVFESITDLGGFRWVGWFVAFVAGVLLGQGRWLLSIVWILVIVIGGTLNDETKEIYKRPRPSERDPHIMEKSPSFPSGHSMGSIIAYGMLAYLLVLSLPPRWWGCYGAVTALALLVLAIGFSRMYLGAHWFSDVVAGFVLGAAWLAVCIGLIETGRRRSLLASRKRQPPPMPSPGVSLRTPGFEDSPRGLESVE
jgi:undecaprenyl-diphosphatase